VWLINRPSNLSKFMKLVMSPTKYLEGLFQKINLNVHLSIFSQIVIQICLIIIIRTSQKDIMILKEWVRKIHPKVSSHSPKLNLKTRISWLRVKINLGKKNCPQIRRSNLMIQVKMMNHILIDNLSKIKKLTCCKLKSKIENLCVNNFA